MRSEFEKLLKQHRDALTDELVKLGKHRQAQLAEWDIEQNESDYEFYFNAAWNTQQSKIDDLQLRIDALSLALDKIAYPIPHMQKEADLNGCELNGYWAVKMSEDHTYSKDIARKALDKEQAL